MLDPITIGVFVVLAVVVAVFIYFAKYGEDDSNFDKAYKDAALNLLSEQREKKQNKSKPSKNKKDKKNEKKDDKADDSPVEKESPTPLKSEPNPQKASKKFEAVQESDKENQTVPQDPEIDVVEAPTAVSEPLIEEKKTNKKNKLQQKKEVVVEKSELVEEITAVKKAPVVQKEKEQKKSKPKKRTPVPTDLDQHKLLGRLANIEEIEPEYIEYISQYFIDATDKENALSNNVLALEKSSYELRQKAEQHCAARITAEREMQDNQRALNESNKRVAQLEKIGQADMALIAQLKAQVTENVQCSVTNTTLDTELAQAVLEKQTAIDSLKTAENDILSITKQRDNLIDELSKFKQEINTLTKQLTENETALKARSDELNITHTDYAELEVLVRKLKSDLEAKRLEVLASAAEINNEKSASIHNMDAKVKEFEEKEQQFLERETELMDENKRLAASVEKLQKENVKFEQFKAEQVVLQTKLEQHEKELAEKTKQIQEQEIFVSNEQSLKIENSALNNKIAELTTLLNDANQEKNELPHRLESSWLFCRPQSPDLSESLRHSVYNYTLSWSSDSPKNSVSLACSLWGWMPLPMRKFSEREWILDFPVSLSGPVPCFKFVVDGEWQICNRYPSSIDENGHENNYLIIEDTQHIDWACEGSEVDSVSGTKRENGIATSTPQ